MEITINNNGDLINTATQEKPVIQDTFTITNHTIDEPYKEVEKVVKTLTIIHNLDSLTTQSNYLLEILDDNNDILVENDLEDNINSIRKFYYSIQDDIKELKHYRDKFFVSDNNKKEKLTVKQLKYILSNKEAENVLKMNILTQLHNGSIVNDNIDVSVIDKINIILNQIQTVHTELCSIISNIDYENDYENDYDDYDDYESDYDDYDKYHVYDENGDLIDNAGFYEYTHNELIDHIEDLKIKYSQLKEKYDSLNN